MSLVDNASEAGLSDLLDASDDGSFMPDPTLVVDARALSNTNFNCVSTPPMSPLLKRPVSDDRSTPFSKRHCAMRPARSTARYSAYKIPSREQRQAFNRNGRRKEMFVDDPSDSFVLAAEPNTVPSMTYLALPSVLSDVAATLGETHLSTTPHDSYRATQNSDLSIKIPGVVDRLALRLGSCSVSEQTEEDEAVVDRATQKSGLTIKIPGLVDRLALRFLSSLTVEEQTGEDEDVDNLSLDGYTASASSSDSGDIDDDDIPPFYSSLLAPMAGGPDRSSRRKHRRLIAAPYHRAGGIRKRKELWADTVTGRESDVPAFLLESPSSSAF